MAEPQSSLPTGAYITIILLIGLAALLSWLVASYPSNPSQRPRADDCESIAQQYNQPQRESKTTGNETARLQNNKATPGNSAPDQADNNIDAERQIANYNCQLAIYTKDLAYFTKWLVYATTGLIITGLLQGFFLQKSVRVADRAATEAKDAIVAAQAGADAANAHAKAAEEANKINREILVSANRPWIIVSLTLQKGRPLVFTADKIIAYVEVTVKNIGRSPATGVGFTIDLYPDGMVASRKLNNIDIRDTAGAVSGLGRMLIPDEQFLQAGEIHGCVEDFKQSIREGVLMEIDDGDPFDQGCPSILVTV